MAVLYIHKVREEVGTPVVVAFVGGEGIEYIDVPMYIFSDIENSLPKHPSKVGSQSLYVFFSRVCFLYTSFLFSFSFLIYVYIYIYRSRMQLSTSSLLLL